MNLTPREHEVMGLIIEGYPLKTVAAKLGISDKTVKTQLNNAYAKLGAKNRTHAAAIYARSELRTDSGSTITGNVKDGWRCR